MVQEQDFKKKIKKGRETMRERKIFSKNELTEAQKKKRDRIKFHFRIVTCVVFLLAMAGITYLVYPIVHGVGSEGWLDSVREQISGYGGISGVLVFLAIQAAQVLVAVVPAVQVVGGALYGWFWGTIISFAGIVLGSMAVWGIVKKLGAPLVQAVISEKHRKKFSFLEDDRKLIIILIILYIIPGIPKDVITYLVPLTGVKMRDFFLYVMPWRIPAILLSAAVGSNATKGNYVSTIVFVAVTVVIAVLGLIFKDKIVALLSKRKKNSKNSKSDKIAD